MADITLADGTRIPEYALEITQQEIVKLLRAQVGSDKKSFEMYKKLVDISAEDAKAGKDSLTAQQESVEALRGIRKDAKEGKSALSNKLGKLGQNADGVANSMLKIGGLVGGAVLTGLGFFAKNAYNLGNTLADLGTVGIGLGGIGDSTVGTIASLNRLGLTASEAANLMAGSAASIAQMGQQQFTIANKTIASMSNSGADFGMTMSQVADVLADDLDTRQRLGILGDLDATKTAQRSASLFKQQLTATQILGKSIDSIRDASSTTLRENASFALRIQSIGARLGADVSDQFIRVVETGLGNLSAIGLDQSLIDSIGNEIGSAVAFSGGAVSDELFATLSVVNKDLTGMVKNMNMAARMGDVTSVDAGMAQFNQTLRTTALNMSSADFESLQYQLESLGSSGQAFALSLGEIRVAAEKYGKVNAAEFTGLAQGAKTFDNAMNQLTGGMTGLFTDITGAVGPALGSLASAFSDSGKLVYDQSGKLVAGQEGISTAFKQVMVDISKVLLATFGSGSDVNDGVMTLGDTLRDYVVPKVRQFGEWFKQDGIKTLRDGVETAKGVFYGIKDTISFVMGVVEGVVDVLKPVIGVLGSVASGFSYLIEMLGFATDSTGEVKNEMNALGSGIAKGLIAFVALTKGIKVMTATMKLLNMATKANAVSGGASAGQTAAGTATKGASKLNFKGALKAVKGTALLGVAITAADAYFENDALNDEAKKVKAGVDEVNKKIASRYTNGESVTELVKEQEKFYHTLDSIAEKKKANITGAIGGASGAVVGAAAGAMVGSVVPVLGTAIGGLIGGAIGAFGGDTLGNMFGEALHTTAKEAYAEALQDKGMDAINADIDKFRKVAQLAQKNGDTDKYNMFTKLMNEKIAQQAQVEGEAKQASYDVMIENLKEDQMQLNRARNAVQIKLNKARNSGDTDALASLEADLYDINNKIETASSNIADLDKRKIAAVPAKRQLPAVSQTPKMMIDSAQKSTVLPSVMDKFQVPTIEPVTGPMQLPPLPQESSTQNTNSLPADTVRVLSELLIEQRKANKKSDELIAQTKKLS